MRIKIEEPKDSMKMLHIYLTKKEIKNLSKGILYGEIVTGILSPMGRDFVIVITRDNKKEEKK